MLSPWPTATATMSLAAATAALKSAIGAEHLDDDRVAALGSAASSLVEKFAPTAPDEVRCEALIRCAGWLHQAPSSGVRRQGVGPIDVSYSPAMTGALRASGALGLLSAWKIRRAGAIG